MSTTFLHLQVHIITNPFIYSSLLNNDCRMNSRLHDLHFPRHVRSLLHFTHLLTFIVYFNSIVCKNDRKSQYLFLLYCARPCSWPLVGCDCTGEQDECGAGKQQLWMSQPVSLTLMSKTSRNTSKLRQVIMWTLRLWHCFKLWSFSSGI